MNIFQHILHCLNIPYTTAYSSRVYEEHPYRDSLYGLFRLLALYGGKARGNGDEQGVINIRAFPSDNSTWKCHFSKRDIT